MPRLRLRPASPAGVRIYHRIGRHVEYRDLVWVAVTGTRFLVVFAVVVAVLVVFEELDERRSAPVIPRDRMIASAVSIPEDDDAADFAD